MCFTGSADWPVFASQAKMPLGRRLMSMSVMVGSQVMGGPAAKEVARTTVSAGCCHKAVEDLHVY